jgi:carboxypeptidase Q
MRQSIFFLCTLLFSIHTAFAQHPTVDAIFKNALNSNVAYENLRVLCETTEGRISGTPAAAAAVEFTRQIMDQMGLDTVYLQEMTVPNWKRGEPEVARMISTTLGVQEINITALGLSVGTGTQGISAHVIEVKSLDELEKLGHSAIRGKIVFFNRPVNQDHYNTFQGYSGAVDQRSRGPIMAADYGAVAAIVRSVTTANHDFPHTGGTRFRKDGKNIPALAVSPIGADLLSEWLKTDPQLKLFVRNTSYQLPDAISYNVIGEIRGTTHPEQIITVGSHLDAWDNSQGAHDAGGGCMQSIDVLRIYQELNIQPKRTIRAVMFMDEEIAQSGGRKYADDANRNHEKHYFAIESDRGVYTPRGFSIDATDENIARLQTLKPFFEPWGIHEFYKGGSGVDIAPLKKYYQMTQAGLVTDAQRYFDLHHSANDTFDQINRREMNLGTAAMAALIYLIDELNLIVE